MARRDPREARALGLWSAGWLFVLLVAGLVWIGDVTVEWPVLLVPVTWALVALRRGGRRDVPPPRRERPPPPRYDPAPPNLRTDTVQRPAVRNPWDEERR